MAQITGGHLVARYLKQIEAVDTVFTLSGGHIESILDGLSQYGIRTIDVRHEQAAAMMAHAWTVYRGRPGVCLVTAGPGFTNALTGIANAFLENVPLVVLSGRHPLRDDLTGALQEMNQIDMVKPVVKWCATCHDIRRIPEYLATALRQATTGRPGPVFLELPPDILFTSVDEARAPLGPRPVRKACTLPQEADLQEAARLIDAARQPLLVGGSGVKMSDCAPLLKTFVEKTGLPFALLNYGRGALPDDHPLCINDGGFTGLMTGMPQADVIVIAGLRLNWVMQATKLFPQAKVIRIDIAEHELDRNRPSQVALAGDCGRVLERLLPLVSTRRHDDWLGRLRRAYEAFMTTELEKRRSAVDPIHPARLVQRIMDVFGRDAFYVADGGDTSYWALAGFQSIHPAGVLVPAGGLFGCLGTGIPFALAAKLAHPDKPVIVLNGDGWLVRLEQHGIRHGGAARHPRRLRGQQRLRLGHDQAQPGAEPRGRPLHLCGTGTAALRKDGRGAGRLRRVGGARGRHRAGPGTGRGFGQAGLRQRGHRPHRHQPGHGDVLPEPFWFLSRTGLFANRLDDPGGGSE